MTIRFNEFFKNLPKELARAAASPTAADAGAGLGLRHLAPTATSSPTTTSIDNASKIQVSFDKDNKYEAELVGTDPRTDIALLKIKASQTFPFVKFADKHAARRRLGDRGRQPVRPRRHGDGRHRLGAGPRHRLGPLRLHADRRGREPRQLRRPDLQPRRRGGRRQHRHLQPVGRQRRHRLRHPRQDRHRGRRLSCKTSGSVSRGWLGVKIQNIDEDTAASLGLTEPKGALVTEVTARGPAADAGLKNGDAILSVNGNKVADSRDLARQIAGFSPNTKVDVRVLRGQKEQTVSVKLGKFPSGKELAKVETGKPDPG